MDEIRPVEKGIREPLVLKKRPKYYDHTATIRNASPNPLDTEDTTYNREEISKNRRDENAPFVWVVNDSSVDDLFVRTSSTADFEDFSDENVIHPKDVKVYYNVFELRLRSPTAGLPYRVAEFEIMPCCTGGGGGGGNSTIINTATDPVIIRPLDCTTDHPDICDRIGRQLGIVSLSGGAVDVSDRCSRLLGQLCFGGIAIDPRIIRALSSVTDSVTVTGTVSVSGLTTFTPIQKALQHNVALPAIAGSDILGVSLVPTNTPCSFRITIAISITGQLTLDRINGGVEVKTLLNGGISLNPSVEYTWDVQVYAGDTINLEYSTTGGTVMILRIAEIDAAVTSG